jgi:hypothetical protein
MAGSEQDLIAAYTNTLCNLIEHIVGAFGTTKNAEINSYNKASARITTLTRDRS